MTDESAAYPSYAPFLGTFTPRLDDKGRLILPAKFRPQLAAGLVVTRGQERCLFVFPMAEFQRMHEQIAAFRALRDLGNTPAFRERGISLDGYILTDTPVAQMVGEDLSWVALENQHVLGFVQSTYETLLLGDSA